MKMNAFVQRMQTKTDRYNARIYQWKKVQIPNFWLQKKMNY